MKDLWLMLSKTLAVFTKASVCAMIIWYLRRSFNRGLSEGLLLKVKICYSFKKLFCPVNFISEEAYIVAVLLGSRLKSIYAS